MTLRFALICLFLTSLASGCSTSGGSDYSATIADGRAAAQALVDSSGGSALSVALVDGERVIWAESFGLADKGTRRPAMPDTRFCIGSVSKMFAAVATMILVDQGKVALDEPLTTYIPAFSMESSGYNQVTVRMLLNHSAGFSGTNNLYSETSQPLTDYAAESLIALKTQRLKHAPGAMSVYTNDGFTMVENLVKAVSGKTYPEFVRQEIFNKLGMSNSIYPADDLPDGTYAKTYDGNSLLEQVFVNSYGSGGLYSTASDMARFAIHLINHGAFHGGRILSTTALEEMGKDQSGTFNPLPCESFLYGLGWDSVKQPGLKAVGVTAWQKGGDASHYGSNLIVAPSERLAVVVMGASGSIGSGSTGKLAERILLRALVEKGSLPAMPAKLEAIALPVKTVMADDRTAMAGFYGNNTGVQRMRFTDDNQLVLENWNGSDWSTLYRNLKLRNNGWYSSDADPLTELTAMTAGGRSYLAFRYADGYGHYRSSILYAQRLDAIPEISDIWKGRTHSTWVLTNEHPSASSLSASADPRFTFSAIPGLAGYVLSHSDSLGIIESGNRINGMFMQIPTVYGRDLNDIVVESRGGGEWIRFGSLLYRPLSGIPALGTGAASITIGPEGYAEWRKLPSAGTVTVSGCSAWKLYRSDFSQHASGSGNGSLTLPGTGSTSYIMLFGVSGASIALTIAAP